MPVQNYTINTRDAVAGELYGLQQTRADIQTSFAEVQMGFGLALARGAKSRGVKLGHDAGVVLAISLRQINREALTRPSDGSIAFLVNDAIPSLYSGRVNVQVKDAGAVTRGQAPFIDDATGEFYVATAVGRTQAKNILWGVDATHAAGDITHVNIITGALPA